MQTERAIILHADTDYSSLGRARQSFSETLRKQERKIAILEGVSGGALCHAVTNPGSTRFINGGATPYSREEKIRLGVPKQIIESYGEYSPQTARAMALLARWKEGTDLGIGITGSLESNENVFVSYVLGREKPLEEIIHLNAKTRRSMKNELTVRVLSSANLLLNGKRKIFNAIPFINEPADLFLEERNLLTSNAEKVVAVCKENALTLGTMESCTGLMMANAITDIAGCSDIFQGGFLAYNENVKRDLGVPFEIMRRGGVYSKEVAAAMAEAIRARMGVKVAFATSGVMDVWDTRPYHDKTEPGTISLAIAQEGRETWCETRHFDVATRDKMKIAITNYMFEQFLLLSATERRELSKRQTLYVSRF